jgi:Subtilase family
VLELEAGVDRAAQLLQRYDRETGTWNVERKGDFWNAVHTAHQAGRFGEGFRIAVIDGAFDTTYRQLATHDEIRESESGQLSVHGTVVALLVLAVAPKCRLWLYPASRDGTLDSNLIARGIDAAVAEGVDAINLSFGDALPTNRVVDWTRFFDPDTFWPDMDSIDLPFWCAERLANSEFREWLRLGSTSYSEAAVRAARKGVLVVAAAGNYLDTLSSPAVCPEVFAAAFHRELRLTPAAMEVALSREPTYTPSDFTDFAIIQPPEVLGSSFAAPLLAGFTGLMRDAGELDTYRDMVRLGGMASELMAMAARDSIDWTDRRLAVVDDLFRRSLALRPHDGEVGTCAECALFALSTYNDFGLFRLNTGALEEARALFSTARAIAPLNAPAAANLGITLGALADAARRDATVEVQRKLLLAAAENMADAVALRPSYKPYSVRLSEFRSAAVDPRHWTISR